jgi:hypothetical protein
VGSKAIGEEAWKGIERKEPYLKEEKELMERESCGF